MRNSKKQESQNSISALKVQQWLEDWDVVAFKEQEYRRRPERYFYIFNLPAGELKALSGVYRRTKGGAQTEDLGIQRRHDEVRSKEIREFIHFGYPWSDLSTTKRDSGKFNDLRKPGWLPTSIVVNILKPDDSRLGVGVSKEDLVTVEESEDAVSTIKLPGNFRDGSWRPKSIHPIEVIDGQHRLWAFEGEAVDEGFQLPVIAFHGLDLSWQAYLFWVINIRPKRITPSLAFDLYPLLRLEDWLERFEGHPVYRETRAQELTEALWSHSKSPLCHRINMLGEPGLERKMVTQAAWIRSLMATFVKASKGPGVSIGGLFGARVGQDETVLPWSRAQQAAFLICVWQKIKRAIGDSTDAWAQSLREVENNGDPAFDGPHTLLNTDQGVRGVLYVANDFCFVLSDELKLQKWVIPELETTPSEENTTTALNDLKKQPVAKFLALIADSLADYDWRTASAPELSDDVKTQKLAFRGSGGYKELRRQLLRHLSNIEKLNPIAEVVLGRLGYTEE